MKNQKPISLLMVLLTVLLLAAVVTLLLVSCEDEPKTSQQPERIDVDSSRTIYRIYVLDGCEYVCFGHNERRWGGHKGDCSNPVHLQKTP
jgi:hypothetical protein